MDHDQILMIAGGLGICSICGAGIVLALQVLRKALNETQPSQPRADKNESKGKS